MQEIVINTCCGGFNLSMGAIKAYYKLKGKEIYSYYAYDTEDMSNWKYKKTDDEKAFCLEYVTIDCGESCNQYDTCFCENHVYDYHIPRDDKDLVAVVKQLGDKANGDCAKLSIVEIPDDVKWKIEEYDGFEHIAEVHRTWH